MPFERNIRGDTATAHDSTAEVLARGISEVLGKTTRVAVLRYRLRRKDPTPLLEDISVRFDATTENAEVFSMLLARELIEIAENDCDGRRAKFRFSAFMAAPAMSNRDVELWGMDATIDPTSDGDDEPQSRDSEAVRMMERSGDLMGKTGDHYVKLLDKVNGLVGVVGQALDRMSDAMQKQGDGEWKFRIEEARMRMEADMHIATERASAERNHEWAETVRDAGEKWSPVVEMFLSGKSVGPTPEELAIVFRSQDDIRELALRYIREKDKGTKDNVRIEIKARWGRLSDDAKAVIIEAVQELPEPRRIALGLWAKSAGVT